jgi:hypothetical protein
MKNSKKIDRLFQEKFKDFEATPNEKIWKNIESSLQEKEGKRRIIPFWWKFSGIAALIIVSIFIGNQYVENSKFKFKIQSKPTESNRSTNSQEQNSKNEVVTKTTISNDEITNKKNAIVTSEKVKNKEEISKQNQNSTSENKNLVNGNKIQNVKNKAVVSNSSASKAIKNKKQNPFFFVNNSNENAVVSNKNKSKNSQNSSEKNELNLNEKNNAIDNNALEKAHQLLEKNKSNAIVTTDSKVKNTSETDIKISEKNIPNSKKTTNPEVIATITDPSNSELAKHTKKEDEIAWSLTNSTNELEAILAQKEKDKKKKNPSETNRWQITSAIAPIFFGSTSDDSPVDAKFNNNSKSYENSLSYGVGLQYNLTKKLTIRTGINKLDLDYTTNDVAFLENTQNSESLVAVSTENTLQFVANGANPVDGFTLASNSVYKGTLRQEFGYYEIPFELSYAVINKKIKVNVITGLSTLFLDENAISLTSQKYNMTLGEANNVNKINFSTNVGLGINYNLYKSFYLNLDSILKYQMNTFNSNSGNFNPYIIGLYSGLSYKF